MRTHDEIEMLAKSYATAAALAWDAHAEAWRLEMAGRPCADAWCRANELFRVASAAKAAWFAASRE